MWSEVLDFEEDALPQRSPGRRCENCDGKLMSYEPDRTVCDRCRRRSWRAEADVVEDWERVRYRLQACNARDGRAMGALYTDFVARCIRRLKSEHHDGYVGTRDEMAGRLVDLTAACEGSERKRFKKAFDRLMQKGELVYGGDAPSGKPIWRLVPALGGVGRG